LLRANAVRGVHMKYVTFAPLTSEVGNSILDVIFGNVLAYRPDSVKTCDSPSNLLNPLIRCGHVRCRHPFLTKNIRNGFAEKNVVISGHW
jgi:hypothetical protein